MLERLKIFFAVVIVVIAIGLCLYSGRSVHQADTGEDEFMLLPPEQSMSAPSLHLAKAQGDGSVDLKQAVASGPVVLEFWATWCGPCREEMPHIVKLSQKYRGRVQFYGVNSNDSPSKINQFVEQYHIPYPTLVDSSRSATDAFGASTIPLLVIIDQQGRIRMTQVGYDPIADTEQDLSQDLDSLLAAH